MSEEVKEEQVQTEEFVNDKTLDEIINEADVYVEGKKVEKEEKTEEKVEEKKEEVSTEEKVEEKVEKTEETTEQKVEEKVELTPEVFEELAAKYPELKKHRDVHDDFGNWEKNLRQKAQAIGFLSKLPQEQQELLFTKLLPYAYKQEEMPKTPLELVDDIMKKVDVQGFNFKDEDDLDVNVSSDIIKPHARKIVESALNMAVPEMAALRKQVLDMQKERDELKENYENMRVRTGNLELQTITERHPDLGIKRVNDNESILEAIARVGEVGEGHPDYKKYLRIEAVCSQADRKGLTLDQSYEFLYGQEERKNIEQEKTEETIVKNQESATQEIPDGSKVETPDWENAMEGVGAREAKIDKIFRDAGA